MATQRVCFFATRKDVEPVVDALTTETPLQFMRAGSFDLTNPPRPHRRPDFAQCDQVFRSWLHTPQYLVAPTGHEFKPHVYKLRTGETRGSFDQRLNPETVVVSLGGRGGDRCLIAGEVTTLGEAEGAQILMRAFRRELVRRFEKVHSFMVGDEALALLNDGWRLTTDISSPQDADLRRATA